MAMVGTIAWHREQAENLAKAEARARRNLNPLIPGARVRHDGWTEERTKTFLALLSQTGCVRDACRVTGMSNNSAYRHKRRCPEFAAAWDKALANANKGLVAIAYSHATVGKQTVIIRNGEEVERRIAPSDAMLSLLIKRSDAVGGEGGFAHADLAEIPREEIITLAEYRENIRFDPWTSKKYVAPDGREQKRIHREKLARLHAGLRAIATSRQLCPCCEQPLPPEWPKQSVMALDTMGVIDLGAIILSGMREATAPEHRHQFDERMLESAAAIKRMRKPEQLFAGAADEKED